MPAMQNEADPYIRSQNALRQLKENDDSTLKTKSLEITTQEIFDMEGEYYPDFQESFDTQSSNDDFSKLGQLIGMHKHLYYLGLHVPSTTLKSSNHQFFEGLKCNSSIGNLHIYAGEDIADNDYEKLKVIHETLRAFEINGNLTRLTLWLGGFRNGLDCTLVKTLRSCTKLNELVLSHNNVIREQLLAIAEAIKGLTELIDLQLSDCNINDEQLLPLVEALSGKRMLEKLSLYKNRIGIIGYKSLAALLADPNCNLRSLCITCQEVSISNEGVFAFINSLAGNNQLQELWLGSGDHLLHDRNREVAEAFVRLVCDTTSINSTHCSNHTLRQLSHLTKYPPVLEKLFKYNKKKNKSHVAILKTLHCHPEIDMEPLFKWDLHGERSLKALPQVVAWFDKALEIKGDDEFVKTVNRRKLSAIYKFARAMPIMFVPPSHAKVVNNKRKADPETLMYI